MLRHEQVSPSEPQKVSGTLPPDIADRINEAMVGACLWFVIQPVRSERRWPRTGGRKLELPVLSTIPAHD